MRHRAAFALWALALVAFPLIGNLATNTIKIPESYTPWIWGVLTVLAIFALLQIYLGLPTGAGQRGGDSPVAGSGSSTLLRFLGGSLEVSDLEVKLVKWGSRPLIVPWSEVVDIHIGLGDDWPGDYADVVALGDFLLAQPTPASSLLTTSPSMSAYDSRLNRIRILNLERVGIPRHAVEAALSRYRP